MSTPRRTRLVRAATLAQARRFLLDAAAGPVDTIRRTAIIVPASGAAEQVRRGIEDRLAGGHAAVVPHLFTRDAWLAWLFRHVSGAPPLLSPCEREVLLGASARHAAAAGFPPPFRLRVALVGGMLDFYDTLRRQSRTVDDLERLAAGRFERDAEEDRGAARLLAQARFMVAAFREYERRLEATGCLDEHTMRPRLLELPDTPLRRVVVAVGDRAADPHGLWSADFDTLTRLNGLEAIDVVATEAALRAGLLNRLRECLPGLDEDSVASAPPLPPLLVTPADAGDATVFRHRDREDELTWVAGRIVAAARSETHPRADRVAVVYKRPLPYVYLAGRVFADAGIPWDASDALPLASEPAAAALDQLADVVASTFARKPLVALLRSPHFAFGRSGATPMARGDAAVLDRELADRRYLGDPARLASLADAWLAATGPAVADGSRPDRRAAALARAAVVIRQVVGCLGPLSEPAPPSHHLGAILDALTTSEGPVPRGEPQRGATLRARAALCATVRALRAAHERCDDEARPFDETRAELRRWIERQTFSPPTGAGGVVLADADAARFGDFDVVYLVGLTQQEWPDVPPRNVFFPTSVLRDLSWPDEADRHASERATFLDLLRLPTRQVLASTFTLEDDAIVEPSPLAEELADAGLETMRDDAGLRVAAGVDHPAGRVREDRPGDGAAGWAAVRASRTSPADARFHGRGLPGGLPAYKVSALDRYLECPFVFFAEQVLRLAEEPTDDDGLSPRLQGQLLHAVFERFFARWDQEQQGSITPERLPDARRLFEEVVEASLGSLPDADAALMRARLLGSPVTSGAGEIVISSEAERPAPVIERLLEFRLNGPVPLASARERRTVELRATADRIDLLADGSFRVVDYKLSKVPDLKTAIQLPAYAAAARARLEHRGGFAWRAADAAYIAFGKPPYYRSLADAEGLDEVLAAGEMRLLDTIAAIEAGIFPPRPRDPRRCAYCASAAVCRKDYVHGD